MHPGIHSKVKFPLTKTKVQPGMIVEFMYQSSYQRSGKKPTGPRNVKRLLWVLDPYFGRQAGGGDDVDSRGFYMWGIDLEKVSPAQFAMLGPKKFGIEYWGPKPGEPITEGSSVKQTQKFPHIIPIVDVAGQNGQAKWAAIKSQKMLVENYRSYDIDRIKGCQVVQYYFTDSKYKVNLSKKSKPSSTLPKTGDVDVGKSSTSKLQ